MRLLERDRLLAVLTDRADRARRREGQLVLVSGEAGIGKTALLERLEEGMGDARWAWGACDGLFTPRPLGPLFDLAARLGGQLREVCESGAPREAMFAALLRALDVPVGPVVLAVEDVHWADEATLDLLRFLARRLRGLPVLLLVTYRDDALAPDDPLRTVLGELVTHRSTTQLTVPALSLDAVGELAAGTAQPEELFRLTGGNPFFVAEVLRGDGGLPVSVRDAVLARVAGLSATAGRVLEAAALSGTRVDPDLLEAVEPLAGPGIDECLSAGLLTDDGAGVRFRHELARVAVEAAVPSHRRTRLHARLLAALRARSSADDARLAYHAEGARDTAAVLHHAPRAARRAAELASHREAAAQYERALRFADGESPAVVAHLYDRLAYEASLVDRWQEAADARLAALPLWRQAGDRLREGDTLRLLWRTMWRLCRGAEASTVLDAARQVLEPLGPSRELAWCYANLAGQRSLECDYDAVFSLAADSKELAEKLDLPDVLSDALDTEACAAASTGRPWTSTMLRSLDVARSAGLDEQAGRAYANGHGISCTLRQFVEAERWYAEGLAFCDDRDVTTYSACLRGERTSTLAKLGRWDEGIALATELLERPGPSPVNRLNPLISLGLMLARRGEQGVESALDEAAAAADGTQEDQWIAATYLARTEAAWLAGDAAAAARELARAAAPAAACNGWLRGEAAVWRRRLGIPGGPDADDVAEPYALALTGHCRAAAELWSGLGCPYDAALARYDSGDETARREALDTVEALGARPAARLIRRELRRSGVLAVRAGPRASTRSNRFGLTRREQEVLDLVAEGLGNSEISRRLFISERTVDHHVSAVLTKMGVRSRGQAASVAVGLGPVGTSSAGK